MAFLRIAGTANAGVRLIESPGPDPRGPALDFYGGSMCSIEMDLDELGQIGYDAYSEHTGNLSYRGEPLPAWSELPDSLRGAWYAAAGAVFQRAATDLHQARTGEHGGPVSAYAASRPIPADAVNEPMVVVSGGVVAGPAGCCREQGTPHVDGLPPADPEAADVPTTVVGHPLAGEPGGRA